MVVDGVNLESVKTRLFKRFHRTGEEMKLDLPNILKLVIDVEGWKYFTDAQGQPYKDLCSWLHAPWPVGPWLDTESRVGLTYDDVMKLCEGHPEVYRILADQSPNQGRGRPKKGEANSPVRGNFSRRSDRKPVLAARLAQKHPTFYDAYLRGDYKSIRAAAEAAGLVKSSHNPLQRLNSYWRHATEEQRKEFSQTVLEWIESNGNDANCDEPNP